MRERKEHSIYLRETEQGDGLLVHAEGVLEEVVFLQEGRVVQRHLRRDHLQCHVVVAVSFQANLMYRDAARFSALYDVPGTVP
jgi:hypothetical protein